MDGTSSRRGLLRVLGGVAAGAALSACGEAPSGPAAPSATPTSTIPATTPEATPTAQPPLRFAVASDGHLGEPKTDSERFLADLVSALNAAHDEAALDFVVINGDIGHGGARLLEQAKAGLDELAMPWFVTQGNHDQVSAGEWRRIWGRPANDVQRFGERSIVLANTSNRSGDYLCADLSWLERTLRDEAGQRDVLVFMHITPKTWTEFGVDCPDVRDVLAAASNVRAVFNGHDHDQTGVKSDSGVPYLFDAHYGGHWGTPYRAFRLATVTERRLATRLVEVDGGLLPETTLTW